MTTITVARKNGMAAIAADSLGKWGYVKESAKYIRNSEKIIQVNDNFLAITGPSSAQVVLADYFSTDPEEVDLSSVASIFREWLRLHDALKEHYFLNERDSKSAFESTQMDVLIANPHGIFGVSEHRDVQEFSRFDAYGSGSEFANGAMFTLYDDPTKSAEDIARFGVEAAAEFDDGTGLPIISYSIALLESK